MSDRSLLVVCENFDPNGSDDASMFQRAFRYAMRGVERTGMFTVGEAHRADMSPEEIVGRLSRATALVVVLDGSRTIGPKCAAAIVGAEDSGVPYIVLVPMLFLIELAGVPPEEIATGRKIPKALGTTFALDIEGGRMEIPSFRFTSALDMAIQFTLGAIAGLGDAMKGSAEGAEGAEGAGGAEGAS